MFRLRSDLVISALAPASIQRGYKVALSGVTRSEVVCVHREGTRPARSTSPWTWCQASPGSQVQLAPERSLRPFHCRDR